MWLPVISLSLTLFCKFSCSQQIPIATSPGILITQETGQVLYEATAPIIFQFQVPVWDNFLSVQYGNCRNSTFTGFCNILEKIELIAEEIKTISQPATFNSFPEQTHSSTWGLKCNYISQHFSSFRVDSGIIQKYLGFLRSCSNGIVLEEELISDYVSKPTLSHFKDAGSIFEEEFLQAFDPSGDILAQNAIQLNFLDSLLSTGLSSYISQTIGWNSAISNCKNGLIPDQLLTPAMFHQSLKKLNQTAFEQGWSFAISSDEEFLPFYFKNKLVDCTFSDNVFYVRVLVPMVKSARNWLHISAQPIKFYNKVEQQEFVYERSPPNEGTYFYEVNSQRLFSSRECDTNQPAFCRLPELWGKSLINEPNCVSDVLSGKDKHCSGSSVGNIRTDFLHLPFVVKENTDIYYLTGLPEEKVTIKCQAPDVSELTREFYFPQEKGLLKVQLPCFCLIAISPDLELSAEAPCHVLSDMLNVTEVWHQDFI